MRENDLNYMGLSSHWASGLVAGEMVCRLAGCRDENRLVGARDVSLLLPSNGCHLEHDS